MFAGEPDYQLVTGTLHKTVPKGMPAMFAYHWDHRILTGYQGLSNLAAQQIYLEDFKNVDSQEANPDPHKTGITTTHLRLNHPPEPCTDTQLKIKGGWRKNINRYSPKYFKSSYL